ncbi:MAG TPA: hypothetical protein VGQ55_02135 [Pyrinomonadaceae bacterium]|jgi:hypothetical protein|nr:hypothetical protein [Pyrinomonadaceae bacterium]
MKRLGLTTALERLQDLKEEYAVEIREKYEHKAKSCITCETKGACCLDAHFVNVHITQLEAAAITRVLSRLSDDKQAEIYSRTESAISKYGLSDEGDSFAKTYACPLFEPAIGCLVHAEGKALPCITHACYERQEDLPPDSVQAEREHSVESLNRAVYGDRVQWLPLPVAIRRQ